MIDAQVRKEISEQLTPGRKAAIFTHVNPDGDAIGSSLALALFLNKLGLEAQVLVPNGLPDFLKWLPGSELLTVFSERPEKATKITAGAELMFFLDFNEMARLDKLADSVAGSSAYKILIDHHEHPEPLADLLISEPGKSSVGEMIFEVISALGRKDLLDQNMATNLYVAIMTDTGNFRHSSSDPGVFRVAGELMKYNIDKDEIFSRIYDSYSHSRMQLLGYCLLEKMVVLEEYHTAYISITRDELKRYNHRFGDTEGFVNVPFSIRGIRFTALFIEKEHYVKVSLRSKGAFSVDAFAVKHFDGGGHINAAGGQSDLPMAETLRKFEQLVVQYKDEIG